MISAGADVVLRARDFTTPNTTGSPPTDVLHAGLCHSVVCTLARGVDHRRNQYWRAVGPKSRCAVSHRVRGCRRPPDAALDPKKAGYRRRSPAVAFGQPPDFGPLQSGYDRFYGFRAGVLDYFTHKYGPPSTDTEDLWEDDVKIRQTGYLTDLLGSRAVDVVNEYARSGEPFLVSLHFNAPHWPWEAPGDEAESQRLTSLFHFDGGTQRTYQRMIQQMDLADWPGIAGARRERRGGEHDRHLYQRQWW
jgi:hypothetical protein